MNGYLVDTNILSELTKLTPATQVEAFLRQSKDRVFVSVFFHWGNPKGHCVFDNEIMPWFGNRVLPWSLWRSLRGGATLSAQLKAAGRPRPVVDAVLAATASLKL